ncbi:MAG: thioredoxin domain-containing protein [Bacteroidota bacterium]
MNDSPKHTNRLINASSPYLLQHAHNPVDWWEWCDEAFEKARREDKLVLVSIGYSACHWCHVMERECFEKEDTAAIMNEHFVCIKIDREERPDIDQIYMDAVQLLTGSGGWPLNCFVLPDGRPIHGGTYFPKHQWEQTLVGLSSFYLQKKEEALTYATNLTGGIRKLNLIEKPLTENEISFQQVTSIVNHWSESFDREWGGFNWAPKFPMPANLQFFLHYGMYQNESQLLEHVNTTLTRMANGGLFDQLQGGFARYSTDVFWKAPHFEKMLYDNGQLLSLYANAYLQFKNPLYKRVMEKTHQFIIQELTSKEGLFYSALDADSEGVEGKYYVWEYDEVQQLLGDDAALFCLYYSITENANWEEGNILYKSLDDEELIRLTGKTIEQIQLIIQSCESKLLTERSKRIKPGLDDKIITSWNALLIKGYADAYLATGNNDYLKMATTAADALWELQFNASTLNRIYKNGKSSITGFSEDYAALCEALLSVYEASGEEKYAHQANQLMQVAIEKFYGEEKKLFYFTDKNSERLIAEKYDVSDDVIPSSNSLFAKVLIKLGYLFDNSTYHQMVDDMLNVVSPKIEKYPTMYGNWLQVVLWKQKGFYQLVYSKKLNEDLQAVYYPNLMRCNMTAETTLPLLKEKAMNGNVFYLCKDKVCNLPEVAIDKVLHTIEADYK